MSFRASKLRSKAKDRDDLLTKQMPQAQEKLGKTAHAAAAAGGKLKRLPQLKDCKPQQQEELFLKKLEQCCIIYNFLELLTSAQEKEIDLKTNTLTELTDYISSKKNILNEKVYPEIIRMVSANIFRTLPEVKIDYDCIIEQDDAYEEPSWVHLKLVYQLFVKFLDLPDFDPAIAGKYIDQEFIIQLLETFNTKDPRERTYLKTALHRIYGKLLSHRGFIRQHINNIFLRFIYETEDMNGIPELLEIFGSIINGFVLPLKLEHKVFLEKVLIPLHKPLSLHFYHAQLAFCIMQFVEKDQNLAELVIQGLLKFWPITFSQKQVYFLDEVEEIMSCIETHQLQNVLVPLFKRIAKCICSPHFMVSQKALYMWNNDEVIGLVERYCDLVMPIVFPALADIVENHWNNTIVDSALDVLQMFEEMHPELFLQLQQQQTKVKEGSNKTQK